MHYAFSGGVPAATPLQLAALAGPNPGGLLMYRYRPPGLAADAPLVVILHGCGQSAAALDQGAGWSALAQRFGFAILAPEQTMANNIATCFNWFEPADTARGQGEAASIHQMIVETAREFSSDPKRIFITGLSAGGGMTSAMLAAYPEIFAAGAIIAGLPHDAAANIQGAMSAMHRAPQRSPKEWGDAVRRVSNHKGPWPRVSVWHGDADRTVGISNQAAIVAQWRDVHGLTGEPQQRHIGTVRHESWPSAGTAKLESYTLPGLGHGVPIKSGTAGPDACGRPAPFILEAGISSSFHIAEFFGLTKTAPAAKPAPSILPRIIKPKPSPAIPAAAPEQDNAAPSKHRPVLIKTVIVKALKAAGLIKKS